MLDVVVNNMAYAGEPSQVNYGSLQPLNKQDYFHPYCPIDYSNRTSTLDVHSIRTSLLIMKCWTGDSIVTLPDINTENTEAQKLISNWITKTVSHPHFIDNCRFKRMELMDYASMQLNQFLIHLRKW